MKFSEFTERMAFVRMDIRQMRDETQRQQQRLTIMESVLIEIEQAIRKESENQEAK